MVWPKSIQRRLHDEGFETGDSFQLRALLQLADYSGESPSCRLHPVYLYHTRAQLRKLYVDLLIEVGVLTLLERVSLKIDALFVDSIYHLSVFIYHGELQMKKCA